MNPWLNKSVNFFKKKKNTLAPNFLTVEYYMQLKYFFMIKTKFSMEFSIISNQEPNLLMIAVWA